MLVSWLVVINTIYKYPTNSLLGMLHPAAGAAGVCLLGGEAESRRRESLMTSRTQSGSPYMQYAKLRSAATYNLAQQRDHELSAGGVAGDAGGPGDQRSRHCMATLRCWSVWRKLNGVTPDCVVTAAGTSMANHLALAATLEPGDEVLVERPTYELVVTTLEYLGVDGALFRAPDGRRISRRSGRSRAHR